MGELAKQPESAGPDCEGKWRHSQGWKDFGWGGVGSDARRDGSRIDSDRPLRNNSAQFGDPVSVGIDWKCGSGPFPDRRACANPAERLASGIIAVGQR